MIIPIFIHMPKFYADVVLVPLGYLAMAIAIARSLDALSDPLMGWISDHTHTRLGRRRPYMLLGAPLCGVAFFALLNPPESLTGGRAAIWFGVTFILYFVFHTIYGFRITRSAPTHPELSRAFEPVRMARVIHDPRNDRRVSRPGNHDADPSHKRTAGIFPAGDFFARNAKRADGLLVLTVKERPDFAARESNPLVPGVRRALRNRPFAILLASYVVGSIAAGAIPATMMPFFNAYVIRPKKSRPVALNVLLGYFVFGFLSLPVWVAIARRVGKLKAYLASFFLGITGGAAMFLLGPGDEWWLLVLICWAEIGFRACCPDLFDAGRCDRLRRELVHRQTARGAVTARLVDAFEFVAIPSAAVPIADRIDGLRAQRDTIAARGLRDPHTFGSWACGLRAAVVPDRADVPDHRKDSSHDPRRHRATQARRNGARSNDEPDGAAAQDWTGRRRFRLVPGLFFGGRTAPLSAQRQRAAGARCRQDGGAGARSIALVDRIRAASREFAADRSGADDFNRSGDRGNRIRDFRVPPDASFAGAQARRRIRARRRSPLPPRRSDRISQRGHPGARRCRRSGIPRLVMVSKTKLNSLVREFRWKETDAALAENPALISVRDERGRNWLHLCCGVNLKTGKLKPADSIKTAEVLLRRGLNINHEAFTEGNPWKATPLWYAIARGENLALAEYLLKHGSTPNYCLWAASFNDDFDAIRLLVRYGANVNDAVEQTRRPSSVRSRPVTSESAEELLKLGSRRELPGLERHDRAALHAEKRQRQETFSDADRARLSRRHKEQGWRHRGGDNAQEKRSDFRKMADQLC